MNIALGKSFLRRLLGMILQVDAELICVLATSVSSPCIRWRLAKYFLVFFSHFREMPLTGLLMFPASIWLHSYPAPAVCFWLFLLADSRTWLSRMFWRLRNLRLLFSFTFSFVVFCLCPIPINFTRRASNVKPAINWPFMISSAKIKDQRSTRRQNSTVKS